MLGTIQPLPAFLLDKATDELFAMSALPVLMPLLDRIKRRELFVNDPAIIDHARIRHALEKAVLDEVRNVRLVLCTDPFDCACLEDPAMRFDRARSLARIIHEKWSVRIDAGMLDAFSDEGWRAVKSELVQRVHDSVHTHLSGDDSRLAGPVRTEARESVHAVVVAVGAAILTGDAEMAGAFLPLITTFDRAIPVGRERDGEWLALLIPLRVPDAEPS